MTSLWLIDTPTPARLPVTPGLRFDVVVVGAGLTGLTTALLLAQSGVRVAVVEARRIGDGTTGATTAKVSLLQGVRAQRIRERHSGAALRQYLDANAAAQQWLLTYCEANDIPFQLADALTYAQAESEVGAVRAEHEVLRAAGLPVEYLERIDTPFPSFGAVRLAGQAQLNPMGLLSMLAADIEARGVPIYESSRVLGVGFGRGGDHVVDTEHGPLHAETVVLATGTPILDRGGFFARLIPQRSYLAAFRTTDPLPHGMYLSAGEPTRSLRYVPDPDGDILLVGGNGHVVGRETHTEECVNDLIEWTRHWFPSIEPITNWSAQDYEPTGELPYVGPILPGVNGILVGTGYAKWGMTNAIAAALALSGRLTGKPPEWSPVLASWRRSDLASLPHTAATNAAVAQSLSTGWIRLARTAADDVPPPEGCGRVERRLLRPTATCTVGGVTTQLSAVCPHLYGIVRWNAAERSWDCPLHGSRFAADGTLLEGPATESLPLLHKQIQAPQQP
ncbi:FAD-dependent oxidoreductase [Nocardia yamanashiensis]|uniref:FAD-dependent oxidoreductase n=1 Tax=Nocardia yamanashiensis TaxID=209247 RepID=UPI00082C139A|nr:FAD-dependent oxidoreductase [Nocardia yamanashiensis]